MTDRRVHDIFSKMWTGYAGAVMGIVRLVLFLAFIGVVSFAVTFPLWYWALHSTPSFTYAVAGLAAAAVAYPVYRRAAAFVGRKRREGSSYLQILKFPLLKTGRFVLLLAFLYGIATLIASGLMVPAILLAVAAVLSLGYVFFTR